MRKPQKHKNLEGIAKEMKTLTEILEIADKRTKGNWFADGREIFHEGGLACVGVTFVGIVGFEGNAPYIATAPEMEAKLRAMKDMLPELRWALTSIIKIGKVPLCKTDSERAKGLLNKLKEWDDYHGCGDRI